MAAACALIAVYAVAFLALVTILVLSGTGDIVELSVTPSYTLVDCAPSSSAGNSSAFRERLLPLLAALPAAAAPPGFASLRSHDRSAFVRGLCLGLDLENDCQACLAAAAKNLTGSCPGATRRAGVWRNGSCFVSYADSSNSSAREDAFSRVVFSGEDPGEVGPNCFDTRRLVALAQSMARHGAAEVLGAQEFRDAADLARSRATGSEHTVRVFPDVARVATRVRVAAQCASDRAAGCARCLRGAARQVPPCSWGLDGAHVRVADVVGYGCFLRIETSVPPLAVATPLLSKPLGIASCVVLMLVILVTLAAVIAAALLDYFGY